MVLIHTHTHFYVQKMLCSCGPCRHAVEGDRTRSQIHLLTAHVNTYRRSSLIFIPSCNQTFRLQGSLHQRKNLPKQRTCQKQLSHFYYQGEKVVSWMDPRLVMSIIYLLLNLFHLLSQVSQ